MTTLKAARRRFAQGLYPREPWTPSQWAELAPRRLGPEESSVPGDWKNDNAPYLIAVMDAVIEPGLEELVVLKGAQVGYSEVVRNLIGYWVDLDPGPTLIVMPDQKSAEDLRDERIEPLVQHTPAVARHLTDQKRDKKKHSIRFDTMRLFVAWAGSSQGLKSRPIRYLLLEEPDEYPAKTGGGGDPISKALKRLTTYSHTGRARALIGGTPTTRHGNVWKRWEACGEQLQFSVPCPRCDRYQILRWQQVKWSKLPEVSRGVQADMVQTQGLAWYECEHCGGKINDEDKPAMLRRGKWIGLDQSIDAKGDVAGKRRRTTRLGFRIPALISPWVGFGKLVAEWLLAQDDQQALIDFINQRLAEPFEQITAKIEPEVIERKVLGPDGSRTPKPAPMLAPPWTQAVFMSVDTQQSHFWYVLRAWGAGERSQLLRYGIAVTVDELYSLAFDRPVPMESGGACPCCVILIDRQGKREAEVDNFALSDPVRIIPVFGSSHEWPGWPIKDKPHHKLAGCRIWELETVQLKTGLHRLINDPDAAKWMPHAQVGSDYLQQMAGEQMVYSPKKGKNIWVKRGPNHLWDCETIQYAAAKHWLLGVIGSPAPPPPRRQVNRPAFLPGKGE